jgi:hypothetical protein
MNRINVGRVILGGLVAGVVIFITLSLVHGKLLASDWMAWKGTVGAILSGPSEHTSMKLWFLQSVLVGLTGVWVYAGIRPRYGAGAKTALLAGFIMWLATNVTHGINDVAMGVLPHRIIQVALIGEFVATMLGIFIGAAIYKE